MRTPPKRSSPRAQNAPSASAAEEQAPPNPKAVKRSAKKLTGKAKVLNSATRDGVRHNGSVVILAVDTATDPSDPGILLIRQYRHAANKFLLELPAGRIEPGEQLIPAAKRELVEETGYRARRWSKHVTYYASPGFVSEAMNILFAEHLTLGDAAPEDDERIELHMTPLSEVMRLIHDGKIEDGKTLIGVLLYNSLRMRG